MEILNHICRRILKSALVFFCLTTMAAYAQPPSWVSAIGTTGSGSSCVPASCDDDAYAIKLGPQGQQYITGRFRGTITFSGTTLVSAGGLDIFLAAYSSSHQLLWIVQAGGPNDDIGTAMDVDQAGNVYLAGGFDTTATFGSKNGATQTVTGAGGTVYLAKYSSSGDLVWVQTGTAPSEGVNGANGVAVDSAAGTVYITSVSQGNVTFSSANGTSNTVEGVGTWHMVLAKYDTNGNFHWGQTNEASPNSIAYGVAVDANHNAYVTGWLEDTTTFSSQNGNAITVTGFSPAQTTGDYPDDAFLVKYDTNGNVQWVNHIGGYVARGSTVAISPTGNITFVGYVGNINYGSPGEAETLVTSQPPGTTVNLGGGVFTDPYTLDLFIATYNSAGVVQTAFRGGSTVNEAATGVAYDLKGNLYVSGVLQVEGSNPSLLVREYSGQNVLWTETAANAGIFQTDNTVLRPALAVDPTDNVFVTGGYQGTASFGNITLPGVGASDIYLAELVPEVGSGWVLKNSSQITEYSSASRHSCAPMNVTAGDLLLSYNIVYYNGSTSGPPTLTNSDTQGNTWSVIQTVTIPRFQATILQIQYARAKSSGSDAIMVSVPSNVENLGNGCEEWSGGAPSGRILDVSAGAWSWTRSTAASASAVTTGSNDLVVGFCAFPWDSGANYSMGAGAGYTQDVFNNYMQSISVYDTALGLTYTAGKHTASCTTSGPASNWSAIIAGFLSASGH